MCNSLEIMCNFLFTDGRFICLKKFKETIIFNVNNMFTKNFLYTRRAKEVIHMYTLHTLARITKLSVIQLVTAQYCTVL